MVVPHLPLWVLAALLFAATTFSPVFDAARSAITPEILQGEHYVLGNAVTTTTILLAEVLGAAAGGVAVAFIGVRRSLVLDVATFLLSALFIGLGTRRRPPAARPETAQLAAACPDTGRIPRGIRRPGLAHSAAVRLARGLLRHPGRNRRPICGQARRRPDRGRPGHRIDVAGDGDRHAILQPVPRPAPPG